MANQFSVQPLGGFNPGQAVAGLGQQFGDQMRYDKQEQEKQDLQAFTTQAMTGDPVAMNELFARDPRMGMMVEQRNQEKIDKFGAVQALEAKKAETNWGFKWKQAQTPEQKEALLQEAKSNPLIDIDDDDVGIDPGQADLAVNSMLYGHMGKDAYGEFFGGNKETSKKLNNIHKTQSGELIGQNLEGKWVKAELPGDVSLAKKEPLVQINGGQTEEEKGVGRYRAEAYNTILKNSTAASKAMATLNTMSQLSPNAFEGTMAGAKLSMGRLAKSLGMDVENLTESEVFDSMANDLTLGKAGQLSGAMSDKDIAFLQASVPQLSQTKDGRKKLISIMMDVARIEKQTAKLAKEFKTQNKGTFDPVAFEEFVIEKRGGKDILSKYFEGSAVLGEVTLPDGTVIKKVG